MKEFFIPRKFLLPDSSGSFTQSKNAPGFLTSSLPQPLETYNKPTRGYIAAIDRLPTPLDTKITLFAATLFFNGTYANALPLTLDQVASLTGLNTADVKKAYETVMDDPDLSNLINEIQPEKVGRHPAFIKIEDRIITEEDIRNCLDTDYQRIIIWGLLTGKTREALAKELKTTTPENISAVVSRLRKTMEKHLLPDKYKRVSDFHDERVRGAVKDGRIPSLSFLGFRYVTDQDVHGYLRRKRDYMPSQQLLEDGFVPLADHTTYLEYVALRTRKQYANSVTNLRGKVYIKKELLESIRNNGIPTHSQHTHCSIEGYTSAVYIAKTFSEYSQIMRAMRKGAIQDIVRENGNWFITQEAVEKWRGQINSQS